MLQYSPVLTDDDLLDIIATSPVAGALAAISRRQGVPVAVADAIAATDDTAAIAELLANKSAQIREETLDRLADRAADFESWHRPLVERPHLSAKAAQRLARFVASSLLESLASRHDLDAETAKAVALVVRRRLDEMAAVGPAKAEAKREVDAAVAMVRARQLLAAGTLDESTVDTALSGGDSAFVEAALSLLSGLPLTVVHKTVSLQSAKGIVAVTWKAKLSPALAVQLQGKLLRLPSTRVLRPVGGDFPLSAKEMDWQIEFLG